LNQWLVREGWALVDTNWRFKTDENDARHARKGLWKGCFVSPQLLRRYTKNMAKLTDAELIDGAPANFATNVLEIAVPPSNPASISSFADLAKPGVKVVVCAPQVPCGAAAETVEKATGTTLAPVSEESSVTDVLGKVTSGEADAGLVYVTDVKNAGDKVEGIPFAESDQAVNTYPIATVGTSKNKELAAAFIAAVTGSAGKTVLSDAGFGTP